AENLKTRQITDAYFHVGPLNDQGEIESEKYPFAAELVKALHHTYPELHIQAWIGQVEKKGGGILDLENTETRQHILDTDQNFLKLGFDGIHYDIEPIGSDDQHFLQLLHDTYAITQQQHKLLSVSTRKLELFPAFNRILQFFLPQAGLWSEK